MIKRTTFLLSAALLISLPANAGNMWYKTTGTNPIYSNTYVRMNGTPSLKKITGYSNTNNSEFVSALFSGAGLATGRISLLNTPSITTPRSAVRTFLDPYIVNINGKNYVLVKDSPDNNWTVENILGYNDSKDDLFASLKALETDNDTAKISSAELKSANIRLVLLNSDQSLTLDDRTKDFDIDKVQYIDMKNLRTALGNKNDDGTFGYFYIIIKENGKKRAYPGRVTFEDKQDLNKYVK
ncbi:hypothetical protein J6P92_04360 [bacterium]|nr:hypothetical protein [bacterium]